MISNTLIEQMFDMWLTSQTHLQKVKRWSKYIKANTKLRKQHVLHHQYSVCLVMLPVLLKLKQYHPSLNTELVKDCFQTHDIAEGLLGLKYDVLASDKKQHHDLQEYLAFKATIKNFDSIVRDHFHLVYLLQFAHKSDDELSMFPEEALRLIVFIRKTYQYEANLFPALESWEYLFYAYEGYLHHQDSYILVNVLRRQVPFLQASCAQIEGFREVLFPLHFEEKLLEFIKENEDIPV